jgi:hypothetical protein
MIDERVVKAVLSIIAKEKPRSSADWSIIEAEADAAIAYVIENGVEIDNTIHRFFEDTDVRRKSETYALYQTENVLKVLND